MEVKLNLYLTSLLVEGEWSGSCLSCFPERKASVAWVSEPAWMLWTKEIPLATPRHSEIPKSSVRGLITTPNVFSQS